MADSSIIKEFLVALGVKVDDDKIKKFEQGIAKVTKGAIELASAVEVAATAAAAMVTKVSAQFEDLYYASQRIGDSVENIRGFSFAIGQVGGSAQGAMAALENMGEFFRSNPGAERFVRGLGVETREANGQMRAMTDIMGDLADRLRAMPYYRAKVVAGVLGIDPRTLQAMLRGTDEAKAHFKAMADSMGVDLDAAAKSSHDFMNDLRDLLALITLTADKIVMAIQPIATRLVDTLRQLNIATDGWSTGLIVLAGVLTPLLLFLDPIVVLVVALGAAIAAVGMSSFADDTEDATSGLQGLQGAFDGLTKAARAFATAIPPEFWDFMGKAIRAIGGVLVDIATGALHLITGQLQMAADLVHLISDLLHGEWSAAWKDAAKIAADSVHSIKQAWHDTSKTAKDAWDPKSFTNPGGAKPGAPANQNVPATAGQATRGVAEQISQFFQKNGLSSQVAAGITAGIGAETRFKTNAFNPAGGGQGAFGIGQWRGPRLAELFRRYGHNPSLNQQLEYLLWELRGGDKGGRSVLAQNSALGAMQAYITQVMRPGNGTAGDLARGAAYLNGQLGKASLGGPAVTGGGGVTMTQKTDINIYGANDPKAAGHEVAQQQKRVNDAMVRQLRTVAS